MLMVKLFCRYRWFSSIFLLLLLPHILNHLLIKYFSLMDYTFQYRLSESQKNEIAQNLIDIMQKDAEITKQTVSFVGNWILTGPQEKRKAFYDVWDIVLKNYMPTTRPVLYRACKRISGHGKIKSFTGHLVSAKNFGKGRGFLLMSDTSELLECVEEICQPGEYIHTFYPLVSVLEKAKAAGGCGFSDRLLSEYICEDEYIMRVDLLNMSKLKWINEERDFELTDI